MTNSGSNGDGVVVTVCESGPLLVTGPITIVETDGSASSPRRQTVALCRCGRSSIAPMCDGSHKLGNRRHR
ncbi:CDGSH iron-sulfur domain-containing protein [Gordonia phthalatica]|uniref:CDGSH iron-sulfur domain-containing protein n=1 Tax=Gordonia phthalatica TaxID=1136941 RepID=UPI0009E86AA7|nr:CDGSH iron-sulfur domain-containing protein [Gordonia phthalatica]